MARRPRLDPALSGGTGHDGSGREHVGRPARRATGLWVRARERIGIRPDDRTSSQQLRLAREELSEALCAASGPRDAKELLVAFVRHARVDARESLARRSSVDRAERLIEALRRLPDLKPEMIDGLATDLASDTEAPYDALREALRNLEPIVNPAGFLADLAYHHARVNLIARRWHAARKQLTEALAHNSRHQAAHVWRVYCGRILGEDEGGLQESIRELLGDSRSALVREPDLRAELLCERAALVRQRDPQAALEDYKAALDIRPAMSYALQGVLSTAVMHKSRDEVIVTAERVAEQAEKAGPPVDLMVELAMARRAAFDYDAALQILARAEDISPAYTPLYQARMATLRDMLEPDEAIRRGQEAIHKLESLEVSATGGVWSELGLAHLHQRDYEAAVQCFETALGDQDHETADLEGQARVGLINAYRLRRQLPEAMSAAEMPNARRPARVQVAAAWVDAERGRYDLAVPAFEAAFAAVPFSKVAICSLARVWREIGQPTRAKELLTERLAAAPSLRHPFVLNELGWTALDLGDPGAAHEWFTEALTLAPRMTASVRGAMVADWKMAPSPGTLTNALENARRLFGDRRRSSTRQLCARSGIGTSSRHGRGFRRR